MENTNHAVNERVGILLCSVRVQVFIGTNQIHYLAYQQALYRHARSLSGRTLPGRNCKSV
jgi:hypothetical protein